MPEIITLRAHQVLCLQGFGGKGYSDAFVAEMTTVHAALANDPEQPVRLIRAPDRLCGACPHLVDTGCTLGGPNHEAHMRAHDTSVLERLGVAEGGVLPWSEVLDRIGRTTTGADLPGICTTCPWLEIGMCTTAMDRLANKSAPGSRARG